MRLSILWQACSVRTWPKPYSDMFAIRKLGEPQDMLGIKIARDLYAGTITICQASNERSLATALALRESVVRHQ
jgi:hypothetical protein